MTETTPVPAPSDPIDRTKIGDHCGWVLTGPDGNIISHSDDEPAGESTDQEDAP
jgi:hypothetical protein